MAMRESQLCSTEKKFERLNQFWNPESELTEAQVVHDSTILSKANVDPDAE